MEKEDEFLIVLSFVICMTLFVLTLKNWLLRDILYILIENLNTIINDDSAQNQ